MRGVSFDIKQGDFIIILGNSGGGKTSLLNILGTIDKQTKVNNSFYRFRVIFNYMDKKLKPRQMMKYYQD